MLLYILFASPVVSMALMLLVRRALPEVKVIEWLAVASAVVEFVAGMAAAVSVARHGSYSASSFFTLHAFGALVLATTVLVGLVATLHSVGYLRAELEKGMISVRRLHQCHVLTRLFLLCMFVAAAATNPIIMWIAIEATTLSTVFLISFFTRASDVEAAWKYLIINSVGLLLGLLGTILFLAQASHSAHTGLATWDGVLAAARHMDPAIVKLAFGLVLIGYGTKMGLAPMHTWKPDAYNKAPMPIVALLSGALLNVAFLAILHFKQVTDAAVGGHFSSVLFIFFGLLSIAVPAFIMYSQGNFKRLFAYSSIEHAGIMTLGFGFGGIGVFGAVLHMVYHACSKSLMFLLSGNIAVCYSSSKISDVTGVLAVMPYTGALYGVGLLSLVGLPPFGMFFSEFYVALAGFSHYPVLAIVFIALLLLVFAGLLYKVAGMLFGKPPEGLQRKPVSLWMVVPAGALLAVVVLLSLYIPHDLATLLRESVTSLGGALV